MILDKYGKEIKGQNQGAYDLSNHPNAIKLAGDLKSDRARKLLIELNLQTQALTKQTIERWRMANQYSRNHENPNRFQLLQIFDDVILDGHLKGAIRNRKLSVIGTGFKITDDKGNENEDATKLLRQRWFKKFMSYVLDIPYWGFSLIQFGDIIRDPKLKFSEIKQVPRRHVIPEYHVIKKEVSDEPKKGIDFLKPPYSNWSIFVTDEPDDLGLLNVVAKEVISKKFALQFWDQFAELFGMPIRIGKTSSRNEKDRTRIESMLEDMGTAAWGLFPEGTEIEIKETNNKDSYLVYDKRVERADKEISKTILGQTMTMEDGSSRSQAEVHERVEESITNADADFVRDVVNDDLIPFLVMHGWPLQNMSFEWDDTYEYSADEMLKVEEMLENHYDIDPQYYIEKYNIPILGRKQTVQIPSQQDDPEKKTLVDTGIIIRLNSTYPANEQDLITLISDDNLEKEAERIARQIHKGTFKGVIDEKLFSLVAAELRKSIIEGYGKDFGALKAGNPDYKMLANLEKNVYQFSAAKNYQQLRAMTDALKDGNKIRPFNEFLKEAQKVNRIFNKNYLTTEYNTAVNSATMASRWVEFESRAETMPNLTYDSIQDKRTRPDHAALDGVTKPITDSFWDTYFPPLDWNCRCNAKQTPGSKVTTDNRIQKPEIPKMFRVNLAKSGLAFPADHPYYDMSKADKSKVDNYVKSKIPKR